MGDVGATALASALGGSFKSGHSCIYVSQNSIGAEAEEVPSRHLAQLAALVNYGKVRYHILRYYEQR